MDKSTLLRTRENADAPETVRTLGRLEEWLSMRPAVVTVFTGSDITAETTQVSTLETMTAIWERGQIPLLTWEPFITLNAESVNRPLERQFYEGEHDELLDRWAQLLEDWTMGGTDNRTVDDNQTAVQAIAS